MALTAHEGTEEVASAARPVTVLVPHEQGMPVLSALPWVRALPYEPGGPLPLGAGDRTLSATVSYRVIP